MILDIALSPIKSWGQIRDRLNDLIWPTDEEAIEYRKQLLLLEQEECYQKGEVDAASLTGKGHPPHFDCPCVLCRKYWEGFWSRC